MDNGAVVERLICGEELECPPILANLIQRCWSTSPDERPPFQDIVCKSTLECTNRGVKNK